MTANKNINWKNLEKFGEAKYDNGKHHSKKKREWSSLDTAGEALDLMIDGVVQLGKGMMNCTMAIFFVIAFAFATAFDGLGSLMKSKKKKTHR